MGNKDPKRKNPKKAKKSSPINNTAVSQPNKNSSRHLDEDSVVICEECKQTKSGAWLVECDGCTRWYHYDCVDFKLDEAGEEEPWYCGECREVQPRLSLSNEPETDNNQVQQSKPLNSEQQELSRQHTFTQELVNEFLRRKSMQTTTSITSNAMSTGQLRDSTIDPLRVPLSLYANSLNARSSFEEGSIFKEQPQTDAIKSSRIDAPNPVGEPTLAENTRLEKDPIIMKGQSVKSTMGAKSTTSKSKSHRSVSSKGTTSSRNHARLEQQRLQAELELQAKLDEEKIALKMEALKLKEDREKRFLEEKFKAMEDEQSVDSTDGSSTTSKHTKSPKDKDKTDIVLGWIENQRKQKPQAGQHPDISLELGDGEIQKIAQMYMQGHDASTVEGAGNQFVKTNSQNLDNPNGIVNSTWIKDNQIPISQFGQQYDLITQGNYQVSGQGQTKLNMGRQSGLGANYGYQTTYPSMGWKPQNVQPNQQSNFTNLLGGQTSQQNPPIMSSQVYVPPSSQWNKGFSQPKVNQPHQSIPTSNQSIGSTNANQQNNQGPTYSQSHQSIPVSNQFSQGPSNQQQTYQAPIYSQQQSYQAPSYSQQQNQPLTSSYFFMSQRPPLTANQIAARHVVEKKLPPFWGNPAEWPDFIQKLISTTDACGFDNTENLDRLSGCLKGNAREIVRSQLSRPECVPSIIETLEQKFGRKEIVVKAVLEEIRSEPPIKADSLGALSNYGYKVHNACQTIIGQQMHFYIHDPDLIRKLVDKLPYQTKIDWARYSENIPQVTLVTLSDWLIALSRSLNRITTPEISTYSKEKKMEKKSDQKSENWKGGTYVSAHNNSTNASEDNENSETDRNVKCEYCSKDCKNLAECSKFSKISIDEKWKFLYGHKKVCRCCLRVHKKRCTKTKECGVNGCSYKHHPTLHNNEKMLKTKNSNQKSDRQSPSSKLPKDNGKTSNTNHSCNAHRGGQAVLYKIIPVTLKNGDKTVSTHAYMDDGSGLTLLESKLAEQLDLRGTHQKLCLKWTSGTVRHETDSMRVVLQISGEGENQHNYQIRDVRTVKSLDLPNQNIEKSELIKRYPYLERIPFQDFEAAPGILIGLDNVKLGLSREHIEGGWTEPIASKTLLGWVVHGPTGLVSNNENQHMQHHVMSINQCPCQTERDETLHKEIEDFFSLENFGVRALTASVESKDVQRAISIMEKTTIRTNSRFETGLLWKYDDVKLPNNFKMAMKRLECQDRRMESNPTLRENINNQIKNFIVKGYARKLTSEEINVDDPRIWYLPVFHHLDPKKPEKVRLVWDAAAKYKGISLNSMLMSGPDNLVALIDILRRFRERCVAIGGDLEEMYHQVQVRKQDRNSQRFLWRDGEIEAKPEVYVMEVLTFGTNCSPSLAQNVKNKNATDFEKKYPEAAKAIKKNHYVDDWLDSQHTVEETIRLAKDVKYVHKQGGFNLRKIISNSQQVLEALGDAHGQTTKDLNVNTPLGTQKVLGMWWDAQTDCFTYSLKYTKLNEEVLLGLRAPTKREVLKTLMSIYDPLGLIAFYLVYLKIILQEVWKAKVVWDQQLPHELNEKWKRWIQLLPLVEQVRIPRLYSSKISPGTAESIELHTFVDASENAYCAVSYLRIKNEEGVDCVLVGAKTKVAPVKPLLTIPRLELLAAVLGTRFAKSIGESLTLEITKRYFWSDSRDVLCWIRSTTRKYRQFVAFRVGEILETSNESEWRWVPGKLNVADDGTKWSKTPNFDADCRWFRGPDFLYHNEDSWPQDLSPKETTEEELHVHWVHTKVDPPSQIVPDRFSKWSILVKAQAISTKYLRNLFAKVKNQPYTGLVETKELKEAECTLYKLAQFDCFYDEIITLSNIKQEFGAKSYVKKSSSLYKCSPYLDEEGLLRIRGRIDNISGVKFGTKRPIIMPSNHKITELVVNNYHRMYLHRNSETVINELKQKYFIPKLRALLKQVMSKCQTCKNNRAKPIMPEMGDLPIARLSPRFRAFTHTGVDYFGPMNVVVKRGTEKRWGVLFTCLTVRAIHIEIAPSLNADSCILCVRNFTNLRGTPAEFYSDNGTNFKATDRELSEEFDKLDKEKIKSHYTRTYTTWNFNPPASPHFGGSCGSWERLIRTVKENLKMVMFTRTPKEELLRSYLLEIVNVVNSRPLTQIQIDSSEDEALTPNHFIFGSSNGHMAPGEFPYEEKSLAKSWRRSQELTNVFWRRWIKEYLPTLTCRSKWFPKAQPIKIGDIVLLVDEQNARNSYPKGVVLDVLPDKHGQIRRATIKISEVIPDVAGRTKDAHVRYSIKTRPIAKLAVLDIAGKDNEVRPVGAPITKCPNGEENVTDENNVTDKTNTATNPAIRENEEYVKNDNRKLRRSKRISDQKK